VWLVDACVAPLGLLVALAVRHRPLDLLLLLPLIALLLAVDRDRNARIAEARHRLQLVAHERTRLQAAIHRLGEAFAARLDVRALVDVLLHGAADALGADGGRLVLRAAGIPPISETAGDDRLAPLLAGIDEQLRGTQGVRQLEHDGVWLLALPLALGDGGGGSLVLARRDRAFRTDEEAIMVGLVERAQRAAAEIVEHQALREQARTDPLTRLGNRRKLADELGERLLHASKDHPLVLMLFDLNGFKSYNDAFGHVAGDALLARLGHKLTAALAPHGTAYRLGGDEFCVLLPTAQVELRTAIAAAAAALEEHGETFSISASCGTVLLPHEATTPEYALQLADERMYAHKQGRPSGAREQAHDVLMYIMQAKHPDLPGHSGGVAQLALPIGRRLGMSAEELDDLARAATLHDVGKVGIPDGILTKPGPLDAEEWSFVRQHTLLGERILSAAPALRPVATIVRATHERWDGGGYPDGLCGEEIPLAARIVAVCDAYQAITTSRCYRPARTPAQAREELGREARSQFDPAVVGAFLAELERLQTGSTDEDDAPGSAQTALAAEVVARVNELLETAGVSAA
jgi:diguanylate cyclase (GGDEF)-like protein